MIKLQRLMVILLALLWSACGNGGSSGPSVPIGPEEFHIEYCRVVEVDSRMRVEWLANRPTTGEFRFGQTVYTQLMTIPVLEDTHSVGLSGYTFNTQYIYRLTAIDADGNRLDCSGDFLTPDKATPEPILSALTISEITESSARVSWETDEPSTTILHYGAGSISDSVTASGLNMDHEVMLTNLSPSTIYAMRPEAVDADGLRGMGPDSMFSTAARLTLWIPTTQIVLGDTVLVPVNLESAEDLAALQYRIEFTEGNVEIVGVHEGPFYSDNDGFNFFRDIQNGSGQLTNAMTWVISYSGNTRTGTDADGDGVIALIELRGLAPGSAGAAFAADSTFGLDMFAQMRSCSLRAGTVTVIP